MNSTVRLIREVASRLSLIVSGHAEGRTGNPLVNEGTSMVWSRTCFSLRVVAALLFGTAAQLSAQVTAELDTFWAEVSRTVAEGDFEAYSATYHPDAIVIFGETTQPISDALSGWEAAFNDTRTGLAEASVQFRFSKRRNDDTTAHETGIFRYEAVSAADDGSVEYIHFEALLVQRDGWKMMMEFQKHAASVTEWETLEPR